MIQPNEIYLLIHHYRLWNTFRTDRAFIFRKPVCKPKPMLTSLDPRINILFTQIQTKIKHTFQSRYCPSFCPGFQSSLIYLIKSSLTSITRHLPFIPVFRSGNLFTNSRGIRQMKFIFVILVSLCYTNWVPVKSANWASWANILIKIFFHLVLVVIVSINLSWICVLKGSEM